MSDIRSKVWSILADAKANECFSTLVVKRYQKYDLALNLILVLSTSSSIAAWAIWNKLDLLWGVIIGGSQVLTLAKPYFLFPKYIRVFSERKGQWQSLTVEIEELWHKMDRAAISEAEAWELYPNIRKRMAALDRMPDDIIFFEHRSLHKKAEDSCNNYLAKV